MLLKRNRGKYSRFELVHLRHGFARPHYVQWHNTQVNTGVLISWWWYLQMLLTSRRVDFYRDSSRAIDWLDVNGVCIVDPAIYYLHLRFSFYCLLYYEKPSFCKQISLFVFSGFMWFSVFVQVHTS